MYLDSNDSGVALNSRVLVLNKLFSAVRVVTARRAFILLYKNSAEVIAKDNGTLVNYDFPAWIETSEKTTNTNGDEFIHTPTRRLRVPRVIRLIEYDKFQQRQEKVSRRNILIRDEYRCQYCGKQFTTAQLSVDHVIPRSKNGASNWENLVACCSKCNTKKGGRLPHEVGMKLIKKPVTPKINHLFYSRLKDEKYALWKEFISTKDMPLS